MEAFNLSKEEKLKLTMFILQKTQSNANIEKNTLNILNQYLKIRNIIDETENESNRN